jgi:hypothetical protein
VTNIAFDTIALSHFLRAGRLEELKALTAGEDCILLGEVQAELVKGVVDYPSLGGISADPWLHPVELELTAVSRSLVGGW